jgi:glutamate carboxypeptidase
VIAVASRRFETRCPEMVGYVRALVECDSPSTDLTAIARCAQVVGEVGERVCGVAPEIIVEGQRPHLVWNFPGTPRVLLLSHFDTVWPVGTSKEWSLEVRGGRATGPGVFDMKAGIIQAFFAIASAHKKGGVRLLLTVG